MTTKSQLWHQAQQARAQARMVRMARLDLLGHGDPALEGRARELALTAAGHEAAARAYLDEMNGLAGATTVEIDWADLTNY